MFKIIYPILSVKCGRNNWVAKEHWQEAAYRTTITEKRVIACGECEKLLEQIKRSCHRKTGSNKAKEIRVYDENRIEIELNFRDEFALLIAYLEITRDVIARAYRKKNRPEQTGQGFQDGFSL